MSHHRHKTETKVKDWKQTSLSHAYCNTAQFRSVEGRGQGWHSETRMYLL